MFTGALRGTVVLEAVFVEGMCFYFVEDDVGGLLEDDCEFAIGGGNPIEFYCVEGNDSLLDAVVAVAVGSADCVLAFHSITSQQCNPLQVVAKLVSQEVTGTCPCGVGAEVTATVTAIDTWPC